MRKFIFAISILCSLNVMALGKYPVKIEKITCGMIDKYPIRSACILLARTTKTGKKLGLLLDIDDFLSIYKDGSLDGKEAIIFSNALSKIPRKVVREALNKFDPEYTYYKGAINSFIPLLNPPGTDMERLVKKVGERLDLHSLPPGYRLYKAKEFKYSESLRNYIKSLEDESLKEWKRHVANSNRYNHLTRDERIAMIKNPKKYINPKQYTRLVEVLKVYNKGRLVGYILNLQDFIESNIIEGKAWIYLLIEKDKSPVHQYFESN